MMLPSNYDAPRYSAADWFGVDTAPPSTLRELPAAIERLASIRNPFQRYSCSQVDRSDFEYDPFPEVPKSTPVLQLDRWLRIVDDRKQPSDSEIRLCDVPLANRRVGEPWFVVEAFIIVDEPNSIKSTK